METDWWTYVLSFKIFNQTQNTSSVKTITIWFGNLPQAQDWILKLKQYWKVSEIASRKGKRITVEVEEIQDENSFLVLSCFPELQNNIL